MYSTHDEASANYYIGFSTPGEAEKVIKELEVLLLHRAAAKENEKTSPDDQPNA